MSAQSLARKTGVSRKTIVKHIKTLEEKGIIKSYTILVDYQKIGYEHYVIFSLGIEPGKIRQVMDTIKAFDQILWVSLVTGPFDLILGGIFKDNTDLSEFIIEKLGKIPGIKSIASDLILYHYYQREPVDVKSKKVPLKLDEVDIGLIMYLRDNARCTFDEIANHLGVNIQTAMYRINRLVKNKIIRKFTVSIDPKKIGYNIIASIKVSVLPSYLANVLGKILSFREISWLSEGSKQTELYFYVEFIDQHELRSFIHSKLDALEGIQNVQVSLVLEHYGRHNI
jgi:Lrp/AsnC family transcriptional regulator for asnA, asnC and gidA